MSTAPADEPERLPRRSVYAAILLCSLGILMQEIVLTRIFSLTIWYHFAYLTISTALLGFGAAGSLLAVRPELLERGVDRLCALASTGAGVALLLAVWILGPRPIDPSRLIGEPILTFLGLSGYYLITATPFFLGGLAIAATLSAHPLRMNRLYAADLLGAGLGCGAAVAALTWVDGPTAIALCAAVLIAAGALYASELRLGRRLWIAAALVAALSPTADFLIELIPADTKALGAAMRDPQTKFLFTRWSPVNRVDLYQPRPDTPPFLARGLSPRYKGGLPLFKSIQYDGHSGTGVYQVTSNQSLRALDYHILRTPYLIVEKPSVLVIGMGGGIDVQNAVRRKARRVVGVDLQPITIRLHEQVLGEWTGLGKLPQVELVASEGRHYIRSHDEIFDIVQLTLVDTFTAQTTGAYVLAESYLYTVEAFQDYLAHLSEGGVVSILMGDAAPRDGSLPPPLLTRLALIAREALEREGVEDVRKHIIVLGHRRFTAANPKLANHTMSVLFKKQPFGKGELQRLYVFAKSNGFEVRLGPTSSLDQALANIVHAPRNELTARLDALPLSLEPTLDDRPFFFHVLRWGDLVSGGHLFWQLPGSPVGQLMLMMMLAQALVLGTVLIVLPLARTGSGALPRNHVGRYLLYFLGLGLGFLLIEISFVQKYVLVLGYPTYSLSVTIFSLLVFAALGAFLSQRGWNRPRRFLLTLLVCTIALVIAEVFALPYVRDSVLSASLTARIAITVLLQLPLGIALGMFFPTGLELLRRTEPRLIPWAWAVNGVASVVAAVLAVILGMHIGFSGVAFVAAAIYAVGTLALISTLPPDPA